MSNWAIVIIGWTSIDDKAKDHGHLQRMNEIIEHISERKRFIYIPPCGETGSPGATCEVVSVGHVNHFSVDSSIKDDDTSLIDIFKKYEWEYPEQVVLMYKNEHMSEYNVLYPCKLPGEK